MNNVVERFLNYVSIDTKADAESKTTPSSHGQIGFGRLLANELEQLGLTDVKIDGNGYVSATLDANTPKNIPTIGFIAHLDTSPDFSGANVKPKMVRNYSGGEILLNKELNIVMSPSEFPELNLYLGNDIITTDGTTLLGADDKAGIAEIITALEYLLNHPEIEHGKIRICFTPDEEIGQGADHFDVTTFGAQFAYTMDGGQIGELEYENFNAAHARITIKGRNVHPGYAKGKMRNALLMANKFIASMPTAEVPENTEGYEGFYHLYALKGDVETAEIQYIIRDFDKDNFERRKQLVAEMVEKFNIEWGLSLFEIEIKDQYFNMCEKIEPVIYVVEIAKQAMEQSQIVPLVRPIRGGTDGARLSYMGLPTPNIFAGGHNFHGRFEFVPVQSMIKATQVIVNIAQIVAQRAW